MADQNRDKMIVHLHPVSRQMRRLVAVVSAAALYLASAHGQADQPSGGLGFQRGYKLVPEETTLLELPSNGFLTVPRRSAISAEFEVIPRLAWGQLLWLDSPEATMYLTVRHAAGRDSSTLSFSVRRKLVGQLQIPKAQLQFNNWHRFVIRLMNDSVFASWNDHEFVSTPLSVPGSFQGRLVFGDIPPDREGFDGGVRHVRIAAINPSGSEELKYHWPLQERFGDVAREVQKGLAGKHAGGFWLHREHEEWQPVCSLSVDSRWGKFNAFDSDSGNIFIPLLDSMIIVNTSTRRVSVERYRSPRPATATVPLYDQRRKRLFAYFGGGEGQITSYDREKGVWTPIDGRNDVDQHFYLHAPILSADEGKLVTFGGYGWYRYRNDVRVYNERLMRWETIPMGGDTIEPRQNTTLARIEGPGRYLLFGGQGVASGRQEDAAYPMPDMFRIDLTTRTFTRLWRYADSTFETLPFGAPSLDGKLFYFGKGYQDNLRDRSVYAGRVDTPLVWRIGGSKDFGGSRLWVHNRNDRALILVTLGDMTTPPHVLTGSMPVRIFRLRLPAVPAAEAARAPADVPFVSRGMIAAAVSGILVLGGLAYRWRQKRKIHRARPSFQAPAEVVKAPKERKSQPNQVLMFGPFAVIDRHGREIGEQLSPLLEQMLMLMLLRSRPGAKVIGIDRHELSEIFWPSFDERSSKNNRGVALTRLRRVISEVDGLRLELEGTRWCVRLADPAACDLYLLDEWAGSMEGADGWKEIAKVCRLADIVGRGRLLAGRSYPWLDGIRADVEIKAVRPMLALLQTASSEVPADVLVDLASAVLTHEPANLTAVEHKLRALLRGGHLAAAKSVAEDFRRTYQAERGMPFKETLPGGL